MSKRFDLATNVDEHFGLGDTILRAVLDMAERGQSHAEGIQDGENDNRFTDITRLIEMYREKNEAYLTTLYRPKPVKAA